MKKAKEEVPAPSAPFWLTTFSDMVTLLMVFFILILSFSTIELEKFKGAMSSMQGALGVLPELGSVRRTVQITEDVSKEMSEAQEEIAEQIKSLETMIESEGLQESINVTYDASGIHISMGDQVLFDLGKATIKPEALHILSNMSGIIKKDFKEIYVEGHTDNIPIRTKQFPSNWELSTARALSVVRYLHDVEQIDAAHLAAVGHGEYRPLEPNTTPENRAKNRRVEIFIRW